MQCYALRVDEKPYRAMRQAAGISLRELSRRTGINSGRLSIIERGVSPSEEERVTLLRELARILTDSGSAA